MNITRAQQSRTESSVELPALSDAPLHAQNEQHVPLGHEGRRHALLVAASLGRHRVYELRTGGVHQVIHGRE
eukprot:32484-Prymnesium_polylepis.3